MAKEKNKQSVLSLLISVVQTVLVLSLLAVAGMSFSARIPFLANLGMTFFNITSGSMEPKIPTGALIYAGKYKIEDLKEGDVITFQLVPEKGGKPVIVTHRIAKVEKTERTEKLPDNNEKKITEYKFTTKGDANSQEDAIKLSGTEIIGKYQWHVPYLGYVANYAQQPIGFALLVLLPAAILIVWEIVSLVRYFQQHYKSNAELEVAKLRAELEKRESIKNEN